MALDPNTYFIVIPALFGNGQSSSPSNSPNLKPFPKVSFYDNVRAQYRLVTEKLAIKHARCVLGWSMGAAQTYQWVTQYPTFMDCAVPFCGAAKTSLHNQTALEGLKVALLSARLQTSGGVSDVRSSLRETERLWTEAEKNVGLRAFGRVMAGWTFSEAFYRRKLFVGELGFKDLEDSW